MPIRDLKPNRFTRAVAKILAPSKEGVTLADEDGHIIEANSVVEQLYGWPLDEIIGAHPLKFCPDTNAWKELSKKIWTAVRDNGRWEGVVMNINKTGEQFPILLRVHSVEFNKRNFSVSWARPFPSKTPFDLSPQEAMSFMLLGQAFTVPDIAEQLKHQGRGKNAPGLHGGVANSTVETHLRRVWEKTGQKSYSAKKIKVFAVKCSEAGWTPELELNKEFGQH